MTILTHASFCTTDHLLEPVDEFDGTELTPCSSESLDGPQGIATWLTRPISQDDPTIGLVGVDPYGTNLTIGQTEHLIRNLQHLIRQAKGRIASAAQLDVDDRVLSLPGQRRDTGSAGLLLVVPVLAVIFAVLGVMAMVGGSGPWGAVLLALAPVAVVASAIAGSFAGPPRPRKPRYLSEAGNVPIGLVVAGFIVAAPIPFFIDFIAKAVAR